MSRKKSVQEHIDDGTYRPSIHGPRPNAGPTLGAPRVKPPKLDAAALAVWQELVGLLDKVVKPEDGPQIEQAAVWLAKWREIVESLDGEKPGTVAFSRLVSAASTASKNFDRVARRFGLTPLDRESLSIPRSDIPGAKVW